MITEFIMATIFQILNFIPLVIGAGAILIGGAALLIPALASNGFGVKATGDALAYVRATGARDIFIGLSFIYLYSHGDRHGLGLTCLFTAIVSGADFVITRIYGSKLLSLFHLGATFGVIAYGVWLLNS